MKFNIVIVLTCLLNLLVQPSIAQKELGDLHYHQGDTFLLFNRHDSSIMHFEKAKELYLNDQYWRGVVASDNKIAENLCGTFEL
ncbi:MAG: hypothetical protein ABJH72_23835, partial [Reichenbachiella sp.]